VSLLENKLGYWRTKLQGLVPLQLSTDFIRPLTQSSKGSIVGLILISNYLTALQELSQQQGPTIFMTLLAAFNVLLFRYSGQKDICVGSPISNRTHEELEALIGFFVNTLALRNEVDSSKSFVDLLQQVKTTTIEGYTNQDVPFEKVVEAIMKERDMGRSPLFQVMFVLQNAQDSSAIQLGDLNVVPESFANTTSKFDLSLQITHSVNGSQGSIEYCTDLFREETIVQMITHFKTLLISIVNNPQQAIGSLPMLNQQETNQLLVDFNDTGSPYPADKTIIDLFEEQVKKTPEATALVFETESPVLSPVK
jgi:non-ribosomal peptide synthetase component F